MQLTASGLKQIFNVLAHNTAIDTYHIEVKEKLANHIYNLDMEKAKTVLIELDPELLAKDLALQADICLVHLYKTLKSDQVEEALGYASSIVLPLVQGKAIDRYSESSGSCL